MSYTTYWIPVVGADLVALRAQHQRVFPGNELAFVWGYVKVAVLAGDPVPAGAVTALPQVSVMQGNFSVSGG